MLWFFTGIFLCGSLIFTAIIEPQLERGNDLSSKLEDLKDELFKAENNLQVKDEIEKVYAHIEPMISVEGNEKQQISEFTRLLDKLYSQLNVKIKSVKILPVTDKDHYQKLSIRIEMTCFMKTFLEFIHKVEELKEPVSIEQFDIRSQQTKDKIIASMIISRIISVKAEAGKKI